MDEVIRLWSDSFKPVQQEAESIAMIANGKAVRTSMSFEDQHRNGNRAANGYGRRPSDQSSSYRKPSVSPARKLPPSPNFEAKAKISSIPSPSASAMLSPPDVSPGPDLETVLSHQSSDYHTPGAYAPAGPRTDYFARDRQPSATSVNAAIGKKRPPPPPPRAPSNSGLWVTALYDFSGQSEGDLVFKEGDRIKVVKKTDSTDDWWQGELRGVKGSFPANYCE